jgi:hypothetical protein
MLDDITNTALCLPDVSNSQDATQNKPTPLSKEEIHKYLVEKEEDMCLPTDFLGRHEITPLLRAKMVNWMMEVVRVLNNSTQTLFQSVKLMDLYFSRIKVKMIDTQVHLLGCVSMYVASKFHDVNCICLDAVHYTLMNEATNKDQIMNGERSLLTTLNWQICSVTPLNYIR